jgi:hypothetical protein
MAPLYSKQLPPRPASFDIAETQQRMRDNYECIRQTLRATRRTIHEVVAIAAVEDHLRAL